MTKAVSPVGYALLPIVIGLSKLWSKKISTEKAVPGQDPIERNKELESRIDALQSELKEARQYVENCRKSKEDFLSVMSHEIKTPLTAIAGMTHLMNEAKSIEEARIHGRTMEKSVASLITLIEDVLDYNQIQSGKLELKTFEFDLHQALSDVVEQYRKTARNKDIDLKLFLDPFLPIYIKGDQERLQQILRNLLENSLKFTDSGSIILGAEYIKNVGDFQSDIKFSVTDTGMGISNEKMSTLFDRMGAADLTPDRNFGGKGLGLSICKALVEKMGGQLNVRSEEGKGSKFYFTVNMHRGQGQVNGDNSNRIEDELPEDLSILVVDDNEMNRIMLSQFLLKWKIQCEVAEDGADALKKVKRKSYDMILLDLQMPQMDGYEFTREIRNATDPHVAAMPIIGISADSVSNVHDGVTSAGMNDFITKPFNPNELKEKINKFSQNLQRF